MQKISPFLWFENKAEEAARFYTSVFNNSRIVKIARYGAAGPGPAGSVMTVEFELEGQSFIALNGGPHFKFNEAISLSISCKDQAEIDHYWGKLSEGGVEQPCGWLKDKYGLSWQVTPSRLADLMAGSHPEKAGKAMQTMLGMKKIVIADIEKAVG